MFDFTSNYYFWLTICLQNPFSFLQYFYNINFFIILLTCASLLFLILRTCDIKLLKNYSTIKSYIEHAV